MSEGCKEKIYFVYENQKYQYFDRWENLVSNLLIEGYSACSAKKFMSFDQFKDLIFQCTDEETIKYIVSNLIILP